MTTPRPKKPAAGKSTSEGASPSPGDALASKIDDLIVKSARGGGIASDARTALRELSDDDVTPRLCAALGSEQEKVRSAAVELCTETPRRRELAPLPAILKCLADESPKVRLSTIIALNRGWGPSNGAVYAALAATIEPALAACLKDPEPRVASQAAVVWKRLGLA